jgi:ribosomal protein S6--L-glutamate ligase
LPLLQCSLSVCPDDPKLYFKGKRVGLDFDIIIPRINTTYTEYGLAVLRQFQAIDIYTTDTAYCIELGRDKLRCLQYLMRRNVPFPTTGFAYSKEDFENIINTVGGTPLVIKLVEGTEGVGVFLAEDKKQAVNLLKTFKNFDAQLVTQELIAESAGNDIRAFVVGGKVVAAMRRESQDGDFRANVSLGGHSFTVDLTPEEEDLAVRAAGAIGVNIAGVDIIRSNRGPLVIEINVSPDFCGEYGIEKTANVDVAAAIIDFAVQGKENFDKGEGVWLQDDQKKIS